MSLQLHEARYISVDEYRAFACCEKMLDGYIGQVRPGLTVMVDAGRPVDNAILECRHCGFRREATALFVINGAEVGYVWNCLLDIDEKPIPEVQP